MYCLIFLIFSALVAIEVYYLCRWQGNVDRKQLTATAEPCT